MVTGKLKQCGYLLAWEMWNRGKVLSIAVAITGAVAGWILRLSQPHTTKIRYETLVDGMPMVVLAALVWAFATGAAAWDWNRSFTPSRAIVRLGALDVDIRTVFFAKAFAGWWSIAVLQILLVGVIAATYRSLSTVPAPVWIEPVVRQGLYLSFMRSELLQFLFPFRLTRILWTLGASWFAVLAGMGMVSVFRRVHEIWLYAYRLRGVLLLVCATVAVIVSYGKQDTGVWMLVPGAAAAVLMAVQFRWLKRSELE